MSERQLRRARRRAASRSLRASRTATKAALATGAVAGAGAVFASPAGAASYVVNALGDAGDDTCEATANECTLRDAVDDANNNAAGSADEITFAASLSGATIYLDDQIYVEDPVSITGPGADSLTVSNLTYDDEQDRIFYFRDFTDPGAATVSGLSLYAGYSEDDGGAISSVDLDDPIDLTLDEVVMTGAYAGSRGGAVANFFGPLTITQSTLSGNLARAGGGAVEAGGADVYIKRSTLSGNQTDSFFYGSGGGAVAFNTGPMSDATLEIVNSTISGNYADGQGGAVSSLRATIRSSTVAGNSTAGDGGGISVFDPDGDALELESTIVADNTAAGLANDLDQYGGGNPVTAGLSLIEAPGNAGILHAPPGSNVIGADPQLFDLASFGGPTPFEVHLPAPASPAIDAGIVTAGVVNDQRGNLRTVDDPAVLDATGSDGTDIGSVERQPGDPVPPAPPVPPDAGGGEDDAGPGGSGICRGKTASKINGTPIGDSLTGTGDPDAISGLGGDDAIAGLGAADCLDGDEGADVLRGGGGGDRVSGGPGGDKLRGQTSRDRLRGQGGGDNLNGGGGKDRLAGGGGRDKLKGGPGRDKLKGGGGRDKLIGASSEPDKVNCGGGRDKALVDADDKVSKSCEKVIEVDD